MAALPAGKELTAAGQGDLTGENAIDGERRCCAAQAFFALSIAGNLQSTADNFLADFFGNICAMPAHSRTPFGLRFRFLGILFSGVKRIVKYFRSLNSVPFMLKGATTQLARTVLSRGSTE